MGPFSFLILIRQAEERDAKRVWEIHTGAIHKTCRSHYNEEQRKA